MSPAPCGEIACRVAATARRLGIRTVAVYSDADAQARHVLACDEAWRLGPAPARESYLCGDRILAIALETGAQAIHPGYGFLSENAEFARALRNAGIMFIGPSNQALELLGDKVAARDIAKQVGVPILEGSAAAVRSLDEALETARNMKYPIMLKASKGGGGRGMRVVETEDQLAGNLEQAQREAKNAFGSDEVFLEKLVSRARHLEVQVLGDQHGNIIHLHERDCSVQRRHQKLIEESPSPRLPESARRELCEAAVRLVKTAGYTNAGTVEFIVDQENRFYFIEVNARIQVEHPVTEMVTGIDLIKTQIAVASGKPLPFTQKDIVPRGAAMECRINAEDPSKNFQPCPGKIERIFVPGGYGVRFDTHVSAGYVVPPYYDSMIGKLIVFKENREEAIACMLRCLDELQIQGISTTVDFHKKVLSHGDFVQGIVDTKWVERELLSK